jgi:hypothetical protein
MDHTSATAPFPDLGVRDEDLKRVIGNPVPPRTDLVAVLQHWAAEYAETSPLSISRTVRSGAG